MNGNAWVSLVAMLGWLVLAVGAFRAHRMGAKKAVTLTLIWLAIFVLVTAIFAGVSS